MMSYCNVTNIITAIGAKKILAGGEGVMAPKIGKQLCLFWCITIQPPDL